MTNTSPEHAQVHVAVYGWAGLLLSTSIFALPGVPHAFAWPLIALPGMLVIVFLLVRSRGWTLPASPLHAPVLVLLVVVLLAALRSVAPLVSLPAWGTLLASVLVYGLTAGISRTPTARRILLGATIIALLLSIAMRPAPPTSSALVAQSRRGAWILLRARPLAGWGPATFGAVLPHVAPTRLPAGQPAVRHPLLSLAVETGGLGLLALGWLLAAACTAMRRPHRLLAVSLLAGWALVLLIGVPPASLLLAGALLGLLAGTGATRPSPARWTLVGTAVLWGALTLAACAWGAGEFAARAGERAAARGDLPDARAAYAHATLRCPWVARYPARRAQLATAAGGDPRYWLRRALRCNPWDAGQLALLARAEEAYRHDDAAIRLWERVLTLDPHRLAAREALGRIWTRRKAYAQAITAFRSVIARDPTHAPAWYQLGTVYASIETWEQARACYHTAVKLRPRWVEARAQLAYAERKLAPPPIAIGDLVDVSAMDPTLRVALHFSTAHNVLARTLYPFTRCYLRPEAARRLCAAQADLRARGYALKIYDAYRPAEVQRALWAFKPDRRFVAHPKYGSDHQRGIAVDVTLVDAADQEVPMPSGYTEFSPRAFITSRDASPAAIANRELLAAVMVKHGFKRLNSEWWHFSLTGKRPPLLTIAGATLAAHERQEP